MTIDRRHFIRGSEGIGTANLLPHVDRARAGDPADRRGGSIKDVRHVVILMMGRRSFDHYFGTLRGVRGFGDRHPIPLPNGKSVKPDDYRNFDVFRPGGR